MRVPGRIQIATEKQVWTKVSKFSNSEDWWLEKILSILQQKNPSAAVLTGESLLSEAIDDSLELVELIMVFEDEFHFSLPEGQLSLSMTLQALARLCAQSDRES